jgi:hypothetical protein
LHQTTRIWGNSSSSVLFAGDYTGDRHSLPGIEYQHFLPGAVEEVLARAQIRLTLPKEQLEYNSGISIDPVLSLRSSFEIENLNNYKIGDMIRFCGG